MKKVATPILLALLLVTAVIVPFVPVNNVYSFIPETETIVISVQKDSFLTQGSEKNNEGANIILDLQSSDKRRPVVTFDQNEIIDSISGRILQSAFLKLYAIDNGNNWGPDGNTIGAHRLVADWQEGNGWNVGNNIAGTGAGVTWGCAIDADISNNLNDCAMQWNGGSFQNPDTSSVLITNDLENQWVSFDVTLDVQAFLDGTTINYGWIIKKTSESLNGDVVFASKEATANNPVIEITVLRPEAVLANEYLGLIDELNAAGESLDEIAITQELVDDIDSDLTRIKDIVVDLQNLGFDGEASADRVGQQMVGTVKFYDPMTSVPLFETQIPDGTLGIFAAIGLRDQFSEEGLGLPFERTASLLNLTQGIVPALTNFEDDEIASEFVFGSIEPFHPSTGNTFSIVSNAPKIARIIYNVILKCFSNIPCKVTVEEIGKELTKDKTLEFLFPTFIVTGSKFSDMNANGGRDDQEPGLQGWHFVVSTFNAPRVFEGFTNATGIFAIEAQYPRSSHTLVVIETLQSGWTVTTAGGRTHNVAVGDIPLPDLLALEEAKHTRLTEPFGNFQLGEISGFKYEDANGNGAKDSGEEGLPGWTILLKNATSGATINSTATGPSGLYLFTGLEAGSYKVEEEQQSGYTQTEPAGGSYVIDIQSGTFSLGNDFGNEPTTQANPAFGIFNVAVAPGLVLDYSSGMGGYVTFTQTQLQNVDPSTFAVTTFAMPTISAGGLYTGMDCLGSSCAFVIDMNTGSHRLVRIDSSGQVVANVTIDSSSDLAGFVDNGDIVFDSSGIYVWAQCDNINMVILRLDSNFVETGRIGDCAGTNIQSGGFARDMTVSGTRLAVTTSQSSGINTFQLWNIDGSLVCRFNAGIYTSGTGQITRANNLWYVARSTGIDIISDSCVDIGDITQAQMGITTAIREIFAYTSRDELMVVATDKVAVMNLTSVSSKLYDWPTGDIGQPYKAIGAPEVNQFATLSGTTLKIVQLGTAIEHHNVATGEPATFTLAYNAFTDSYITLDATLDSEAIVKVSATAFTAVSNNLAQDLGTGAYAPNHGVQCVQTSDRCVVGWDSATNTNDAIRVVSTTGATLGTVNTSPRVNPNQVSGISGTTLYMPIQCSASDGDVIIQVYSISGAPSLTGEIGDCAGISVGNTGVKELTVSGTKIGLTTGSATNGFQIWNTAGGRVCTANVASVTHARDETALRWYLSTGSGTIQIYDDSCADVGDITTGQHGITGSIRQVDINTNRDELYIVGDSGVAVMNLTTPSQLLYTVPVGDSGVSLWHNFAVSTGFDQFANLVSNVVQIRVLN